MEKTKTLLKKLIINKFRALENVEIEFGTHITVICGKNGTSKSSILGIAAQIFSFEKDYTKNKVLVYQTITGGSFKSQPREHFRISDAFDLPGSMQVQVELYDGSLVSG
jgi:predicted ATP-binding protein involved in virulence